MAATRPARLRFSDAQRAELLRLAREGAPNEACGILAGRGEDVSRVFPIANVHAEPRRRYRMDPRAQLAAYRAMNDAGLDVIGYYHSHPDAGPATLSATDLAEATEGAYALYVLVVGGEVLQFVVEGGRATAISERS